MAYVLKVLGREKLLAWVLEVMGGAEKMVWVLGVNERSRENGMYCSSWSGRRENIGLVLGEKIGESGIYLEVLRGLERMVWVLGWFGSLAILGGAEVMV